MRLLLLAILLISSCSKKPAETAASGGNPAETTQNYFKTANQLTVQVAYEPGAEPYVDPLVAFGGVSIWWLLEENLNALYQGRANTPVITVPKTLAEFSALPAQSKTAWTLQDLVTLAQNHRTGVSSTTHSYFWVVFLNGHFHDGTSLRTNTIGLSIQGTTILAIFKDVVKSTAQGELPIVPRYVEQSTIVHEMGHGLGLVNVGLPMQQNHEDTAHKAHCSNTNCVMYWLNEGKSDMIGFVRKAITSGSVIMFDAQCLQDSRQY